MTDSIRLHHKHGLNPTLPVCFWCGKERGEIALLGAAYKGEAPMRMVLDYEPCDTCRKGWEQGVVLFEARSPGDYDKPPEFTGRFVVVKPEAIPRMFKPDDLVAHVLERRKGIMDVETFSTIFGGLSEDPPS